MKKSSCDICDINGNTPLYLALRHGHFSIADDLLSSGAKMNVKNKKNESPIDFIYCAGVPESTKKLLKMVSNYQLEAHESKCNIV